MLCCVGRHKLRANGGNWTLRKRDGTDITLGGGLAVALLAIAGFCVLSSPFRKLVPSHVWSFARKDASTAFDAVDLAKLHPLQLELADLIVEEDQPISVGAFADVWRGRYGANDVAIKRLHQTTDVAMQKFTNEILLLTKLESPFVVTLFGAIWHRSSGLACVLEYMDLGNLRTFLARTSPQQYPWADKLLSIVAIVQAMIFLHTFSPPILHRDLKSRNGTKLTDFGESRAADDGTLTSGIGTYQWMAPEVIQGNEYTTAADVYSFGVVLSELSTHALPYADQINPATQEPYNEHFIMRQVVAGRLWPTFDRTHTPAALRAIAHQCLETNPDHRPSMVEIYGTLASL
ncbi:protein kinase [Achlya hypogyna]|uniref:Protein kinase n=1 Tax=Achlya hypogyna TaxID=1202772 RepID=A0A1V9Z1D3_ACHHY|nr:protein kinase [Achlya hypogyna]